jgi:tRNA modification GTPase
MRGGDTIVALSSGALPSGVAVIRLSGPAVRDTLRVIVGTVPEARVLTLSSIRHGDEVLDRGLVAFFPAPHSFTGEDCAELQVHGSPAVVRAILRTLGTRSGVRLAEAGEFTRRGFENGKLDLTEVEGVGDLISAETESQRRQAVQRAAGGLSRQIDGWRERLLDLRAEIEARLDFSDEGDVGEALPETFAAQVADLASEVAQALESVERGRIVREGVRIALAGPPNSGKSSLINALARSDIAIVTDEPGTTRDVREVPVDLGGNLAIFVDMAGLRETDSKAEAEGVRRAEAEIAKADLVLWLVAPGLENVDREGNGAVWRIGTKSDLGTVEQVRHRISVITKTGLDDLVSDLRTFVSECAGEGEPALVSHERDREALGRAVIALGGARGDLDRPEVAAEHLREASHALERLLGRMDAEAVLDRLFLAFCIGK